MDPVTLASLASLLGGSLGSIFGTGKSPASQAQPYLNEITGLARERYSPEDYALAQGEYRNLTSDPSAFLNELMASYKPTKGHQFKTERALKAARNAAAAGGYAGTEQDLLNQIETSGLLEEQGLQNYLSNVLGLYGTGLQGVSNLSQQGFGDLANALGQQATLGYQGAAQNQQNRSNLFNALSQAGAQGLGVSGAQGGNSDFINWLQSVFQGAGKNIPTQHATGQTGTSQFNPLGGNYGQFGSGGIR